MIAPPPFPAGRALLEPSQSVTRNTASALATSLGVQVLNVGTGAMLARMLGPNGKGQLAAILLWPALLAIIGGLGFGEAVTFFVAQSRHEMRKIVATAFLITMSQSLALMGAAYLLFPIVLGHYGSGTANIARLYIVWIPLNLLASTAMAILLGKLEVSAFNRLRLLVIVLCALGFLALYLGHRGSLMAVLTVYIAAYLITLVFALLALVRRGLVGFTPDLPLSRPMLAYSLKSHIGNVSGLANERADQAVISLVLPASSLGFYSVAVSLASPITFIGYSVAMVALPTIAASPSSAEARLHLINLVRSSLAMSVAAALFGLLLLPVVVRVFFGEAFTPAIPAAQVLLAASVILSVNRVISAGLKAMNEPLRAGKAELLATLSTVVGLLALLPLLGIVGAAVASGLAYGTSLGYMLIQVNRLGVSPRALLTPARSDLQWILERLGRAWRRRR